MHEKWMVCDTLPYVETYLDCRIALVNPTTLANDAFSSPVHPFSLTLLLKVYLLENQSSASLQSWGRFRHILPPFYAEIALLYCHVLSSWTLIPRSLFWLDLLLLFPMIYSCPALSVCSASADLKTRGCWTPPSTHGPTLTCRTQLELSSGWVWSGFLSLTEANCSFSMH